MVPEEQLSLSLPEAARRIGIGISTMKQIVARREIKSFHVGRRHLLVASSVREYVQRLADAESVA